MKKEQIELSKLLNAALDLEAICSTSSAEYDVDSKGDTLARVLKRAINETVFNEQPVGDRLDSISGRTKSIKQKLTTAALRAKNPNLELQKLTSKDPVLIKIQEEEEAIYATKIDFTFAPITITEEQRKEWYSNIPDDTGDFKGAPAEFKGQNVVHFNLHKRFRSLIADGFIQVGEASVNTPAQTTTRRNRG